MGCLAMRGAAANAREHVRVARRLRELPLVHAAFARGELSYAKVRALTRLEKVDNEEELLLLARVLTASQLERALRTYRRVTTAAAHDVQEQEQFGTYWDEDGSLVLRGRLAPVDGALVLRALEAARDCLWQREREVARGSAEPRREPRRPTNVDALLALADASVANERCRSGGERYQVVVHIDEGALIDDEGGCELAGRTRRRARDRATAGLRRLARPHARTQRQAIERGQEDTDDRADLTTRADRARPRLPLPRLREPPLRRRPPHPPLGQRRRNDAHQPRAPLPPPPPRRARKRLRRRRAHALLRAMGRPDPLRPEITAGKHR
jgi:hypothetical protein